MTLTLLPLYAESIGASSFEVGLLSVILYSSFSFASPIWGKMRDVLGKTRTLVFLNLVLSSFTICLFGLADTIEELMMLNTLLGSFFSGFLPSVQVLVIEHAQERNRGWFLGALSGFQSMGSGLGSIILGSVYSVLRTKTLFLISATGMILCTMFFLSPERKKRNLSFRHSEAVRVQNDLRSTSSLITLYVSIFVRTIGASGYCVFLPIYVTKIIGLPPHLMGIIVGISPAVGIPFSLFGGKLADRFGRCSVILLSFLVQSLTLVLLWFAFDFYLLLIVRVIDSFSGALLMSAAPAYVADLSPSERRGREMGLLKASHSLGSAVSPLVAGILIEFFGYRPMMVLSALFPSFSFLLSLRIKESIESDKIPAAI